MTETQQNSKTDLKSKRWFFIIFLAYYIIHDLAIIFIPTEILQITISNLVFYPTVILLTISGLFLQFSVDFSQKLMDSGEILPHVDIHLNDNTLISSGTLGSECLGKGFLTANLFLLFLYLVIHEVKIRDNENKYRRYGVKTITFLLVFIMTLHILIMIIRFFFIMMLTYLFNSLSLNQDGYNIFMMIYQPFAINKPYNKTPAMYMAHDIIAYYLLPLPIFFLNYCLIFFATPTIEDFIYKKKLPTKK